MEEFGIPVRVVKATM